MNPSDERRGSADLKGAQAEAARNTRRAQLGDALDSDELWPETRLVTARESLRSQGGGRKRNSCGGDRSISRDVVDAPIETRS